MEGIIDKENERARRFFALLDNMEKKDIPYGCGWIRLCWLLMESLLWT